MTDRVHSLTVVLENDVRTDDVQTLMSAILQLRGVISCKLHVSDIGSHMAEQRALHELRGKISDVLWPKT